MVAPPKSNADLRLPITKPIDDPPDGKSGAGGPVRFHEADADHTTEKYGRSQEQEREGRTIRDLKRRPQRRRRLRRRCRWGPMREDERGVEQHEEHHRHEPDENSRPELIACVHDELAATPTEGSPPSSLPGGSGLVLSCFEQRETSTQNIGAGVVGGQG